MTEDYKDYKLKGTLHAPFSPILMEFQIPQPYIDLLNTYGDKISASDKKSKQLDIIATNEDRLTVLKKYFSDYNEARGNV